METKFYKKIFITPGIVSYNDKNEGILLLKKEVIDEALDSFKNKPVIITHDGEKQVGEVVDCYYNTDKGVFICGFNVWDKKAQELLDNEDFSVSCTYNVEEKKEGGKYHNIDYDEEATKIIFKNLAIVNNPRYQEAKEYLNSVEVKVNKKERLNNLLNYFKNNKIEDFYKKIENVRRVKE